MPVTKSAKKKRRHDRKIEKENNSLRRLLSSGLKKAKKNPSLKTYSSVSKLIDKASKKNLIHKNKAARLKSRIAKLIENPVKKSSPKAKSK